MATTNKTPIYNLKAVVRETGLKPDTLRAWERRYSVPTPQRTESGHRLYSQHDIDTLKWLLERQAEGMSISRAIELWRRLEMEGQDPADMVAAPGMHRQSEAHFSSLSGDHAPLGENGVLPQLREAWIGACLTFDETRAEQLLSQAFALFPPKPSVSTSSRRDSTRSGQIGTREK
jgi:DNA-binding transcriptional MerR regulator